jgi:hypothetical protein
VLSTYEVSSVGPAAQGDLSVSASLQYENATVTVNSLSEVSDNEAYLKVEGAGTTQTQTISSTGDYSFALDGLAQDETVTATLYESSSESNQVAQATDTTPTATITSIQPDVDGSSGGKVSVTVEGRNLDNDDVYITIEDDPNANGDASDVQGQVSNLDDGANSLSFSVDNSQITTDEEVTVRVYETSSRSYELTNQSGSQDSPYSS